VGEGAFLLRAVPTLFFRDVIRVDTARCDFIIS